MNGVTNGDSIGVEKKKLLITRNLQEVLGDDRLDAVLKDRDPKVLTVFSLLQNAKLTGRGHRLEIGL